jgi:transposase
MKVDVTPGQTSDYRGYDAVMDDDLPQPKVLIADKGYDPDAIRADVAARGGTAVIPARSTRKDHEPIDNFIYALRNLVERCINKLKNARRIATRYDKTATSFLGLIEIAAARLWFRHLSTWPKLKAAIAHQSAWTIEIIRRSDAAKGFEVLPRRCVVERTVTWLGRCRRLTKNWENHRLSNRHAIPCSHSTANLAYRKALL